MTNYDASDIAKKLIDKSRPIVITAEYMADVIRTGYTDKLREILKGADELKLAEDQWDASFTLIIYSRKMGISECAGLFIARLIKHYVNGVPTKLWIGLTRRALAMDDLEMFKLLNEYPELRKAASADQSLIDTIAGSGCPTIKVAVLMDVNLVSYKEPVLTTLTKKLSKPPTVRSDIIQTVEMLTLCQLDATEFTTAIILEGIKSAK